MTIYLIDDTIFHKKTTILYIQFTYIDIQRSLSAFCATAFAS